MRRLATQLMVLGLFMLASSNPLRADELPDVADLPAQPEPPAALKMLDGTPVRTPQEWTEKRRPELKKLFQHYMYGYAPAAPGIAARVTKTDDSLLGGTGLLKEIEIRFEGLPESAPKIRLALFLPKDAEGPVPVFVALNSCGNHAVVNDSAVTIHDDVPVTDRCDPTEAGRGSQAGFWAVDYLISRGYGLATFNQADIDPDQHDFSDGIHPHYPDLSGPKKSHWGTIAAWAWGLQRAVDYLVTDEQVDAKRICVTGHSRRGKTALLAGAMDERIALVVPHQSGTGGAALSRNNNQETVERINRVFPHWFNDHFTEFNDNEAKLPIDQHLLMALVAPRALFDTEGTRDTWANFDNALVSIKLADEVYKFLGTPGLVGDGVIEGDERITADSVGNLVQYRLDAEHTLDQRYWKAILDYADVYFGHLQPTK